MAAEISRQSRVELCRDSLARAQGFRTPAAMISTTTGPSIGEALKLVQVGEATAPRLTLTGDPLPARHPHVAAAISSGELGMNAAAAVVSPLDRLVLRVDPVRLDRAVVISERDGMLRLEGRWDVESGAPIKAALEGMVTEILRRNERADDATRDQRSVRQMRADAGPADLDNGILLCTGCHHRVHDDGWEIRIDGTGIDARVWFFPPPWIDRDRTPRPGGRHRYTLRV